MVAHTSSPWRINPKRVKNSPHNAASPLQASQISCVSPFWVFVVQCCNLFQVMTYSKGSWNFTPKINIIRKHFAHYNIEDRRDRSGTRDKQTNFLLTKSTCNLRARFIPDHLSLSRTLHPLRTSLKFTYFAFLLVLNRNYN